MKSIVGIILCLLGLQLNGHAQIKINCPTSCRPILSCNTCWESVDQAKNNGCIATSLDEAWGSENSRQFLLYPNPATGGRFVIENKSHLVGQVQILDQAGKVVSGFRLNGEETYPFQGVLASGLYVVRLTHEEDGRTLNRKLVIK